MTELLFFSAKPDNPSKNFFFCNLFCAGKSHTNTASIIFSSFISKGTSFYRNQKWGQHGTIPNVLFASPESLLRLYTHVPGHLPFQKINAGLISGAPGIDRKAASMRFISNADNITSRGYKMLVKFFSPSKQIFSPAFPAGFFQLFNAVYSLCIDRIPDFSPMKFLKRRT